MKKYILLPMLALMIGMATIQAQETKTLKKVLELKAPRLGGSNGAQVAWHPILKKYYAAMAGNSIFPIGVYAETGKLLSDTALEAMFDIRGMWYNPVEKALQMNGYDDYGWAQYKLNAKGIPEDVETVLEGMNQPDVQQAGVYNPKEKMLYFLNEDMGIDKYSMISGESDATIELALGKTKAADTDKSFSAGNYDVIADYNSSNLIFTGIPGAEIGLHNHVLKQVELYNLKDGYMTRKLKLPSDSPDNLILNFSYANGIYWLFDKATRTWKGYK